MQAPLAAAISPLAISPNSPIPAYVGTEGMSDGAFGLSSLSEKTRKSDDLIM